jgi:hypothetical protein
MNRIHSYLRNRPGVEELNDLMCICRLGPKLIKDFDPQVILKRWLEALFLEKMGVAAI